MAARTTQKKAGTVAYKDMTPEQRERHKESVAKSQRARKEAVDALIKKYDKDYRTLLAEAKKRHGILDRDELREKRERKQLADLAAKLGVKVEGL